MNPTETLRREHDLILTVLIAAEREHERIIESGIVDRPALEKMLDFFRTYADHNHHAKEEKLLFPRMQERGAAGRGGPIGVMLAEHEMGRACLKQISDSLEAASAGSRSDVESVLHALDKYVVLLRAHIAKENNILFPMADRLLMEDDQRELEAAFALIDRTEHGSDVQERYHRYAMKLTEA